MWVLKNFFLKLYKKFPILFFDILAIPIAWYFSYWLRYNLGLSPIFLNLTTLPPLVILGIIQINSYYYFKVYRGLWRFCSLSDLIRIMRSAISTVLLTIPVLYLISSLHDIPRSVWPLYVMIYTAMLCGARLIRRLHWDRYTRESSILEGGKRVLIVGAGHAGEGLIRELKRNQSYIAVGLIDDNPLKKGMEVHGVQVLGTVKELSVLVQLYRVDLIFIAIPSARSATMRRIVNYCSKLGIPFRTLPGLSALAMGRVVEVNALRAVNVEDLLGRDQVALEWDKIAENIKNKRVIVTGGGGSIGSELCRQIAALSPSKLLIVENSEFNLYKIEQELREKYSNLSLKIKLVSVTDATAIDYIFQEFKPQLVFHAAAYKHVPMLEEQVRIAIQNNVLGTQIVAEASVAIGVEKFILISTDKAVNPTNVMGTTKRVAEIYCQNLNGRVDTQFITVRFGNVLGSTGSVVPLFQKQLKEGGPLTVTHPDIQRYFMTIPEACQLILQAIVNGQGGEIFVLDMGEPIKINYLAEQMIRLAGKEPGKDIKIEYTGLRPGEKLYEELFHASEQLTKTEHAKLFKAKFRQMDWNELLQSIRLLNTACTLHDNEELYIILKTLVPEFKHYDLAIFGE